VKITRNVLPISDLYNWLENKSLIINRTYQRSAGLWPKNARTFFIDTILNGFTFPKVTIRQTIDLKTKKAIKEVVDGQQRLTTIRDFINGEFALSSVSSLYKGCKYADLQPDSQSELLSYEVSVDTIVSGSTEEVLEIFRRINSYTLPLNTPEKRHAEFQGDFKWFILEMVKLYSPMLDKYGILSLREIARMEDADLITELCEVIMKGITNRSPESLRRLYRTNDEVFPDKDGVKSKFTSTMDFIKSDLNKVCTASVLTNYQLYSLFSALVYNKYGIPSASEKEFGVKVIGKYTEDSNMAAQNILELLRAFDEKATDGPYGDFVKACSSSTHRIASRKTRLKWFVAALQCKMR